MKTASLECKQCKKLFDVPFHRKNKAKFCSYRCNSFQLHKLPRTKEWREKISQSNKGKVFSEEHKKRLSEKKRGKPGWALGKRWKMSEAGRAGIQLSMLKRRGKNHHNWKGGVSKNRHSTLEPKYKSWRSTVFQRDNWTCQTCKKRSQSGEPVYLEAHHIKSWAMFPELRYNIDNGVTLCRECHKLTFNYAGRKNEKYQTQ